MARTKAGADFLFAVLALAQFARVRWRNVCVAWALDN